MHYRKASHFDILAVKSLWKEVFGDSDDYIGNFITHFGIENCYVCELNEKITAMAFAIPTTLSYFAHRRANNFKYLYACATLPDYRGQGMMRKLLSTIFDESSNEKCAGIFLHPADKNLGHFYRKLGFEDFFYCEHFWYYKEKLLAQQSLPVKSFHFISPKTYPTSA